MTPNDIAFTVMCLVGAGIAVFKHLYTRGLRRR